MKATKILLLLCMATIYRFTNAGNETPSNEPVVKACYKTQYVLRGEVFEAEIFLFPYCPGEVGIRVNVNGEFLVPNKNGVATFTQKTESIGQHTVSGYIETKDDKGHIKRFNLEPFQYYTIHPFASVSAVKMNTLFVGVDNPLQISVAGVPSTQLSIATDHGILENNGWGNYFFKTTSPGKVNLTIKDNSGRWYGEYMFRSKLIPDPIAMCGIFPGGNIPSIDFSSQKGLSIILAGFDFAVEFKTLGFDALVIDSSGNRKTYSNVGQHFSIELQQSVNNCKSGDIFIFQNIKVKGPDETVRNIAPVSYIIE